MNEDDPADWATWFARDAYEHRRGQRALFLLDERWVILYDASGSAQQKRELAALREWLSAESIRELAYAIWPESGTEQGYSFAIVLDTVREHDVKRALDGIVAESERADALGNAS